MLSHEHSFQHPWATVTAASWQKYPNAEWTPHVTHVDYISRHLDEQGRLHTERLLTCQQPIPSLFAKFFSVGQSPASIMYEQSVVDPKTREMVMVTRNLSFAHLLVVEERSCYRPTPFSPEHTTLYQECRVKDWSGWSWLAGQIEEFCLGRFQVNAAKGRKALEEGIDKVLSSASIWCGEK